MTVSVVVIRDIAYRTIEVVRDPRTRVVELLVPGLQGPKGDKGDQGDQGDSIKGDKGDKGDTTYIGVISGGRAGSDPIPPPGIIISGGRAGG